MEALYTSPYFGVALSVITFGIGVKLQQKTKSAVCNPLIIAIVLTIGVLLVLRIPYESYNKGGEIINMFLAPATACLAVSIYTKLSVLKKYWLPIIVGCIAGSLASMGSVYVMCRLFRLDESLTMSMLPKSVTTPIAVGVAPTEASFRLRSLQLFLQAFWGALWPPCLFDCSVCPTRWRPAWQSGRAAMP